MPREDYTIASLEALLPDNSHCTAEILGCVLRYGSTGTILFNSGTALVHVGTLLTLTYLTFLTKGESEDDNRGRRAE